MQPLRDQGHFSFDKSREFTNMAARAAHIALKFTSIGDTADMHPSGGPAILFPVSRTRDGDTL